MLGIPKYKPQFYTSPKSFKDDFNKTLSELIGKRIERFWLMWDVNENEWLADGPVVLEINGDRFEFTVYQLDEFSMTISSFELSDKLDWYESGDEMPLIWKENAKPELIKNLNREIIKINILTYDFYKKSKEEGYILVGIEFILKKDSKTDNENIFSIYNGLDQNELNNTQIQLENQIKRIEIIG